MSTTSGSWRQEVPSGLDVALAGASAGAALLLLWLPPAAASGTSTTSVLLVGSATLPLAWRRIHPYPVFLVVGIAALAHVAVGYQNSFPVTFAVLLGLFTVAQYAPRRLAWLAAGQVAVLLPLSFGFDWSHQHQIYLSDIPYNYGLFASAWVLGDDLRQRRMRLADIQDRHLALQRERENELRAATAQERLRIARELHDVVAHSVTVMVVQAGAARRVAGEQPAKAREALAQIERTGRETMTELRSLLGVTRRDTEAAVTPPPPRLDDLPELIQQARSAGLDVELEVAGEPRTLREGLELSGYRIVQEALTNSMKHSSARKAKVFIQFGDRELLLRVVDCGHPATGPGHGRGHGLNGMRERAALLGGTLEAGRSGTNGWQVVARLPIETGS